MSNVIKVGISDLNVAKAPDSLVTYALGSCVGICLYDSSLKLGGLSHILLPSSAFAPAASAPQPHRFADTAIPILVKRLEAHGARGNKLVAKIAGGAQMFAMLSNNSLASVGERNVLAVKECLRALHIPIIADDTGKDFGRTLVFDPENGAMRIKSATRGEWVL